MEKEKAKNFSNMLLEAEVRSIISNYKITKKKNEEAVKELYSMLNDKNSLIDNCRESVALYRKTADSCVGGNSNYSTDSIDTIELAEEKYRECVKDIKVAISIMLEKSLKNDRVWSSYLSLPYKYKFVLSRLYETRKVSVETWRAACEDIANELGCSVSKIKSMQKKGLGLIIKDYQKYVITDIDGDQETIGYV